MKSTYIILAVAAALTVAGAAHAQQQQFGRDSVYAIPGKSTRPPPAVVTVPINRFGRDSVYVTQTPNAPPSTPVGDANDVQQYGRDSVYAHGSTNPAAATSSGTTTGSLGNGHGG